MCGIIGYIGSRPCLNVIYNGLLQLEYRGYDSAGIVLSENSNFSMAKTSGKLKDLKPLTQDLSSSASIGMGHTRWATHGRKTDENAHPHLSMDKTVSVVHNGIIDNYLELKDFLTNKIIETGCKEVGVYRLTMKTGSDNFKDSSVLGIIHRLVSKGIAVTVYEPSLQSNFFLGAHVENNFNHFKAKCELIIANRMGDELDEVKYKVFTRDIFLAN